MIYALKLGNALSPPMIAPLHSTATTTTTLHHTLSLDPNPRFNTMASNRNVTAPAFHPCLHRHRHLDICNADIAVIVE